MSAGPRERPHTLLLAVAPCNHQLSCRRSALPPLSRCMSLPRPIRPAAGVEGHHAVRLWLCRAAQRHGTGRQPSELQGLRVLLPPARQLPRRYRRVQQRAATHLGEVAGALMHNTYMIKFVLVHAVWQRFYTGLFEYCTAAIYCGRAGRPCVTLDSPAVAIQTSSRPWAPVIVS